jgi:hypothetical protein
MKYLKPYESIYNDNRPDAKYKVGDIVKNKKLNIKRLLKILHISSEFNSPKMPIYDCLALNYFNEDSDNIYEYSENEIRFATEEEKLELTANKFNL